MDLFKEIIEYENQIQSLEGELSNVINTLSRAVVTIAERDALIKLYEAAILKIDAILKLHVK